MAPLILRWAALAATSSLVASCSLIYDIGHECAVDADCASHGAGLACRDRLCVQAAGGSKAPGQTNDAQAGPLMPTDLLGETCLRVSGVDLTQPLPDDALVVGALHPLSGQLEILGGYLDHATESALTEINQVGGIMGRPLVVVTCDTETNPVVAVRAARHLIDVARVPAVLGPFASSEAVAVYTDVLRKAGVLMVSAGANSPVMGDLATDGLIWSTSMSAARQSLALFELLRAGSFQKVAVVNRDDTWGNAMRDGVQQPWCEVSSCSSESYRNRVYDVANVAGSQSQIVAELDGFGPDVVLLLAYVEDALSFLNLAGRSQRVKRIWVNDSLRSEQAFELVADEEVLCRLIGTTAAPPAGPVFESFVLRFEAKWGPGIVPYTPHAYDAAYVLAFALAAATAIEEQPSGTRIATQMRRLSQGEPIEPGLQRDWVRGIQILQASAEGTIDYRGASGNVDFVAGAGAVVGDIEAYRLNLQKKVPESLGTVFTADGKFQPPDWSAVQDESCAPYLDSAQ